MEGGDGGAGRRKRVEMNKCVGSFKKENKKPSFRNESLGVSAAVDVEASERGRGQGMVTAVVV